MKKVNLINKKIMSTGLASSLLVATLGAAPCSAYDPNNTVIRKIPSSNSRASSTKNPSLSLLQSQPQLNSNNLSETDKEKVETKNNLQISMPNSFERIEKKLAISDVVSFENIQNVSENEKEVTKIENEENNNEVNTDVQIKNEENIPAQVKSEDENNQEHQISEEKNLHDKLDTEKTNSISKTKVEDENNQEPELEPQVNEDKKPSDKLDTKKNDSMSKKEMAKTAAKVVAVAAIVGAATYFGYKYRAPIAESLTKGSSYISDKASSVASICKSGFIASKNYLANKTTSFANTCKSGLFATKGYLANKATSIIDKCKNIFNKSKKSVKPLQTEYSNTSLINDICPINQSELWKCPLEKQSLLKQLENGITSKATTAFKLIKSFLNVKSAYTHIKNLFTNNEASSTNSRSFVRSNCTALLPKEKLILPEPIKKSEIPATAFGHLLNTRCVRD